MQKFKYLFLLAVITLSTFFAALPSDVFASANDFSFKKFNADYYLAKSTDDSSEMQVIETLVAEFPNYNQNHGIERKIPFLNQDGTNLTMKSPDELDIEVTRNGASEPYTVVAYSDYFLVRIGDPDVYVQGEQTYVLKYKFIHTITEFDASTYSLDAYQELYWDSNGTGWSQSFDEISVNLRMDKEIYKNLKSDLEVSKDATYYNKALIHQNNTTKNKLAAWCYVGRQGSSNQNRCDISDIENGINFSAKNLARSENLTFVTNFNQDTFYVPKNKFIKKLYFSSATFDYYLSKNSDNTSKLSVKETITGFFPTTNSSTGLTRHLPFTNQSKNKFITKSLKDFSIKVKQDGKNLTGDDFYIFESANFDGYYDVETGNYREYLHDEHTFELEYDFSDIVYNLKDVNDRVTQTFTFTPLDKFYYDIEKVTVNLHLDQALLSNLDTYYDKASDQSYYAYCTDSGSKNAESLKGMNCTIEKTEDGYSYTETNLASGKPFSISVHFKEDTFKILPANRNYLYYHIFVLVLITLTSIFIFTYNKTLKNEKEKISYLKNLPIIPQYTPPKDLTAAQAAELYLKHTKNPKVATMLELIIDKKIALKKGKKKLFGGYEWSGEVLNLAGLSNEQRDLLKILNNGRELNHIGDKFEVKNHSYSRLLEDAFENYDSHIKHKLYVDKYFTLEKEPKEKVKEPDNLRPSDRFLKRVGIIALILVAIAFFSGTFAGIWNWYVEITGYTKYSVYEGAWTISIMIILAFIVFLFIPILANTAAKYRLRTEKGLAVTNYLDGLKLYIKMAEKDRLELLQSVKNIDTSEEGIIKLNEKLLPYAALFGLEKSWMKELGKYYELSDDPQPDWYTAGFSYSVLHSIAASAMSRPIDVSSHSGDWSSGGGSWSSSSSSSGGGGSGFSGGGGGGGGGGGW